jgi:site-specific recombinase XerD
MGGGGLFDDLGPGAEWSPASRRKTASGYGRWLSWLQGQGLCDPALPPGQRVSRDRVAAYVDDLRGSMSSMTLFCRVQELTDSLRVLAPGADWGWLRQLQCTLQGRAIPSRDKRQRMRPAGELAALGEQLMASVNANPNWSRLRQAVRYRDGLMIALLAYRPMRRKNFAALRLGQQVVQAQGRHTLTLAAAETKTKAAYQAAWPAALESNLHTYLNLHRPILLAGETGSVPSATDGLWISEIGTHLEAGALAVRIKRHTEAVFGQSLSPHLFRDCAATSIAIDTPLHVRDSQHVLGHGSLATTERYYNQAQSIEAARHWQQTLAELHAQCHATALDMHRSFRNTPGYTEVSSAVGDSGEDQD